MIFYYFSKYFNKIKYTRLHRCIIVGDQDQISSLIDSGFDLLSTESSDIPPPLEFAIQYKQPETVKKILEHVKPGLTDILTAIKMDDCNILEMLLEAGGNPNDGNNSPLRHAIFKHNPSLVSILIEKGANCNGSDLIIAAKLKEPEIIRLLLPKIPSDNLNESINSALLIARQGGDYASELILTSQASFPVSSGTEFANFCYNQISSTINDLENQIQSVPDQSSAIQSVLSQISNEIRKLYCFSKYLNERDDIMNGYLNAMAGESHVLEDNQTNERIHNLFKVWSDFVEERQKNEKVVEQGVITQEGLEFMQRWQECMDKRVQAIEKVFKEGLSASLKERTLNAQLTKLRENVSEISKLKMDTHVLSSNFIEQANAFLEKIPPNSPENISNLIESIKNSLKEIEHC